MKIVFAAGGTGGHVSPAISIAQAMRKLYPECEILFVARSGGKENDAIIKSGFELKTLRVSGLKRKLTFENIRVILQALAAKREAKRILAEFKPDAVVGTGGYVCWPTMNAAISLGIKTVIHESNVYPGLVTRRLKNKCSLVLLGNDGARQYLNNSSNLYTVGNPVAEEFGKITKSAARRTLRINGNDTVIVSFAGSGGAEKFNGVIGDFINRYSAKEKGIRHFHATGRSYYSDFLNNARKAPNVTIVPYIDNMPLLLRAADIVISRCGAMTLAELSSSRCCSILIPSPNVADDHQRLNALEFAKCNAASVIEEQNLSAERLWEEVTRLRSDPVLRHKYSECIEKFAISNSDQKCCEKIASLIFDENI